MAYRDGKGWNLYDKATIEWLEARLASSDIAVALLRVALQCSSIARESAHGTFFAYVDHDHNDEEFWKNLEEGKPPKLQRLRDDEPSVNGTRWLTGKNLLGPDGRVDFRVARLVIRAASLDGCIIFCRPRVYVKYFGRRLNFVGAAGEGSGGTKRASARSFVDEMVNKMEKPRSFAITVSSDGPIRVYLGGDENLLFRPWR